MNLTQPLANRRGMALIFVILVFAAAVTGVIGLLSLGVHLKDIEQQRVTRERLQRIRKALENYYLIHHHLPDPTATTPANSVPTRSLLLPQRYRFDSNGQWIWYDAQPLRSSNSDEPVIVVDDTRVGAVLVAPGPDRLLQNRATPYQSAGSDDIIMPVPLTRQAIRIATHAVAVLQAAAKAYDALFYLKNNDMDTLYYPPQTEWIGTPGAEEVRALNPPPPPVAIIDEDGYAPAVARAGSNSCRVGDTDVCVCVGVLGNDPSRGTASLDNCPDQAARDLALVLGLGQDLVSDPWGNSYQWGSAEQYKGNYATGLEATATEARDQTRDPHYWSFFSLGPDGLAGTADDIIADTDRIPGYFLCNPEEILAVPEPVVRTTP